jgi:hypothetical protein
MTTKTPPIHKLRPFGQSAVAYTWCLVDPYRKGVMLEIPDRQPATCKTCLREEKKGDDAKPLRRIIPFA